MMVCIGLSSVVSHTDCLLDIYGDDELTDFPAETADADPGDVEEVLAEPVPSPTTVQPPKKPQDGRNSLPPKPATPNSLSYSAQIAQQFSAYQQTPSQERQQRTTIPLPDNPRTTGAAAAASSTSTSPIATHETSNDSVFGKKPSEMHDSGYVIYCSDRLHRVARALRVLYPKNVPCSTCCSFFYIIRLRANTSYDTLLSCSRDSSYFYFFSPAFHVFDLGTNNLDTPWPTLDILLTAYSIVLQHLPLSYGPTCSKLFIGGLNWDTTDGILPLHHVVVCSANGHSLCSSVHLQKA